MMVIEDKLMPDFNAKISQIAPLTAGYYDMTFLNDKELFTDGNHLCKESGKYVSTMLSEWILER
jgi:hypothetical protein